jgi:predicted membrane-bound spermidine synthase
LTRRGAVLLIFLLSGAAGLVYEVVWARQLVLVFGNTTQAISAILTGFFAGMAIGSLGGGRLADRVRSPLRLYGILEVAVAAIALATPVLFGRVADVYRSAYPALELSPTLLGLARFALALAALAPATVLMGATLPTLSRHLTRHHAEAATSFGRLYAANTLGGIVGAGLSGFVLIELFGLTGALAAGVGCSVVAGVAALALGRGAVRREVRITAAPAPRGRTLALAVAFVSGMTSLGYQVLWTRLLSSGTGSTTYVFSAILVIFLVGIAVGALLYSAGVGRGTSPVAVLGATQLLVGVIAVAGVAVIGGAVVDLPLPLVMLVTLLPTTILMGLALPVASGLAAQRDEHVGGDTGALLAANTLGIVVGTFAVPFVFMPSIGSPRAVALLAVANLALGTALLARSRPARRRAIGPALIAAAVIALVVGPPVLADPGAVRVLRGGTLYASAEDEIASVQAGSLNGERHLWVAGTSMTALTIDAKLMPLLPLMARPDAHSALVIAFGMGSSYRTALRAGLDVTGVELVPSVPGMFGYYYDDAEAVLSSPRGRLVIADGRNHVQLARESFDMVVVDPPPPIKSAGTAVLYSREFYAACRDRLGAWGVMMEWMPYDQSVDEFRSHVRTFADVFPHLTILFGPGGNGVFMLGSSEAIAIDGGRARAILARPGVAADLAATPDAKGRTLDEWTALVPRLLWVTDADARRFAGDAPPISDDRPLTEYFLLRGLFGPPSPPMSEATLRAIAVAAR